MNTYVYSIYDDNKINITILSMPANNLEQTKEKLMSVYFNRYDDLNEPDKWEDFVNDLWNKHGILLSHPRDIEEL